MGFKDFMYTEKGKITGSVLAAVLITTAVMVPVSIFTDRAVNYETAVQNVKAFGYDDNKTSTGLRQDNWMGIEATTMTDASGGTVTSMEAALQNNPDYTGVTTDEDLMAGVNNTDGIAYLSYSHVGTDEHLKPLAISEDGGVTYINPGDKEYISAPLNMVMKVPQGVSAVINDHLNASTELKLSDLDGIQNAKVMQYDDGVATETKDATALDQYNYGTWLKDNGLAHDFALSMIAFNYISNTKMAADAMAEGSYVSHNTPVYADTASFQEWANKTFGGENADIWKVVDKSTGEFSFGDEQVLIDGTGTDEAAINLALDSFVVNYEGHSLAQNLNNGGSYRGWETASKDDLPAGVSFNYDEYDGEQNGSKGAFIGTQSRGMEMGSFKKDSDGNLKKDSAGEISYWGYDESKYATGDYGSVETSDMENIIYDSSKILEDDATPTATTLATDQVVFFTTVDTQFEHYGQTYTPTGVTQQGAKMLFQLGATWDEVYTLGLIDADLVA